MAEVNSVLAGNSWGARIFYSVIRFVVVAFCRIWLRLSVSGMQNIPSTGSFILAPIHRSIMDIPIASAVTRRRMRFMGKDSLWRHKLFGSMFSADRVACHLRSISPQVVQASIACRALCARSLASLPVAITSSVRGSTCA